MSQCECKDCDWEADGNDVGLCSECFDYGCKGG